MLCTHFFAKEERKEDTEDKPTVEEFSKKRDTRKE